MTADDHIRLDRFAGVVFDYDGTLVHGQTAIDGAQELIRSLRAGGVRVAVVTNNSGLDQTRLCRQLLGLAFDVDPGLVVAAVTVAAELAVRQARRGRVMVVGSRGLAAEVARLGATVVSKDADVVVTSLRGDITFADLSAPIAEILNGATFISTNQDRLFVTEGGVGAAGGVVAAAIAYATGREPDVVVGKPSPTLVLLALAAMQLPPQQCALVGDNVETDMAAAERVGVTGVLVLTGATARLRPAPDPLRRYAVVASVADLIPGP